MFLIQVYRRIDIFVRDTFSILEKKEINIKILVD